MNSIDVISDPTNEYYNYNVFFYLLLSSKHLAILYWF